MGATQLLRAALTLTVIEWIALDPKPDQKGSRNRYMLIWTPGSNTLVIFSKGWEAPLREVSSTYLPAAYIQTGTAEGVLTANTNGDINLSSVPGRMLVFCPWQFSSQKCLSCCIGDSNKFSDVLSMYRSWASVILLTCMKLHQNWFIPVS